LLLQPIELAKEVRSEVSEEKVTHDCSSKVLGTALSACFAVRVRTQDSVAWPEFKSDFYIDTAAISADRHVNFRTDCFTSETVFPRRAKRPGQPNPRPVWRIRRATEARGLAAPNPRYTSPRICIAFATSRTESVSPDEESGPIVNAGAGLAEMARFSL
jgi:hypothetical protein